MHVVTLATAAQLAEARVLAQSVRRHTAVRLHVVALAPPGPVADDDLTVVSPASVTYPSPCLDTYVTALDTHDLASVALPAALLDALDRAHDVVVHLAPTVEVFAPLDAIVEAANSYGIAVVPRLSPARRDGLRPDDADIAQLGAFRTSVLAIAPTARPALERWLELATTAWMRRAPLPLQSQLATIAAHHGVAPPDASGLHLDAWALGDEQIELLADRLFADGRPVVTFDFAGHDADRPHLLHRAIASPARVRLSAAVGLDTLFTRHADAIDRFGAADEAATHRVSEPIEIVPGVAFDEVMRRLHRNRLRDAIRAGEEPPTSPFNVPDAFLEWCAQSEYPGPFPVSRYLEEVRRGRPDLLDAFPQVPGADAPAFLEWARVHGRIEADVPDQMIAPAEPAPSPRYLQAGVNLAGFLSADLGVGEAARRVGAALDAAHIPHSTFAFTRTANRLAQSLPQDQAAEQDASRFDTNIVCVNADSLGLFAQTVGPEFFHGRRTVGVWFWETPDFPRIFHPAFSNVDEIWAASDYVADALRAAAPARVPVVRFPLPIIRPAVDPNASRPTLDLPHGRFVFLFSFDYQSIAERKNPFGLVDAFRSAFEPDEGPLLVVKSINGDRWPDDVERLRYAARGRTDIELRDGYVDAPTNAALIQHSDCVVSLHRSEGFGFNLADAIALGTPVIASAYSGNLTFMDADDCYLVPCDEIAVGEGHFPYEPASRWGDPDLGEAARLMRRIVDQPEKAAERARHAQARVLADFSPARCGEFIRNRLAGARADAATSAGTPGGSLRTQARAAFARFKQTRR